MLGVVLFCSVNCRLGIKQINQKRLVNVGEILLSLAQI